MNYADYINNDNPRFYCMVYAGKNIVSQFGADTIEKINLVIEGVKADRKNKGLVTGRIKIIDKHL